MNREEKNQLIDSLAERLVDNNNIYLADISELNADHTSELRRLCFKMNIELLVVKNTLLKKAMEKTDKDFGSLSETLKGPTSLMISDIGNAPAKLIQLFRRTHDRPVLKGAFIDQAIFVGDDQLELLANIKSREELIGEVISLLQSPVKNVIGALQSAGQDLSGILKALAEKEA